MNFAKEVDLMFDLFHQYLLYQKNDFVFELAEVSRN